MFHQYLTLVFYVNILHYVDFLSLFGGTRVVHSMWNSKCHHISKHDFHRLDKMKYFTSHLNTQCRAFFHNNRPKYHGMSSN